MAGLFPQRTQREPNAWESLLGGLAEGIPSALEKYQGMQQQAQQKQNMAKLFGEEIANAPPEIQKLYAAELFKNKFAPTGPKPLTELQESQKALADERLKALQGQQDLFKKLRGESQEGTDQGKTPQEGQDFLSSLPEGDLDFLAGFAGQPGPEGIMGNIAENEKKKREKIENKNIQTEKLDRKEALEFHRESSKYDEELLKNSKSAQKQLDAIETSMKAINSGNVRPTSLGSVFKGFGQIGSKIASALQNKDEAALLASIPEFLEGRKELFGVRLSDADLRLLQDKLPDIGKSKEANIQILNLMRKQAELSRLKYKIGSEMKKENKGLRKLGFSDMVEERFDEMIMPVKIRNPNTGNVVEIPAFKVSDYVNAGGEIVNE